MRSTTSAALQSSSAPTFSTSRAVGLSSFLVSLAVILVASEIGRGLGVHARGRGGENASTLGPDRRDLARSLDALDCWDRSGQDHRGFRPAGPPLLRSSQHSPKRLAPLASAEP